MTEMERRKAEMRSIMKIAVGEEPKKAEEKPKEAPKKTAKKQTKKESK